MTTRSATAALLALGTAWLLGACSDDTRREPSPCSTCDHARLEVSDRAARACEALVEAKGGRVASVGFDAALEGRSVTEGDRSGIAWTARADAALPRASADIAFTGTLSLLTSNCYDVDGARIEGATLELVLSDASEP